MQINETESRLLETIAGINGATKGAYNIRINSCACGRESSENIKITPKTDTPGIDIRISDNTKDETCHIPVLITDSGISEMVYNDFYIGDGCDVTIVAGCGIHNCGTEESRHDGVHTFYIGKGSNVTYTEKHYGEGDGNGKNTMNPKTVVHIGQGSVFFMDTVQIGGIDSTLRDTEIHCAEDSEVSVTERLMTHGEQHASSDMTIYLDGENSRGRVISRSVAKDSSVQCFRPCVVGNAKCFGHVQCDSIIMDEANIRSIPEIAANCPDAQLVHEAAIGKIAGEQLLKLETLGLTEQQAEDRILQGFLA